MPQRNRILLKAVLPLGLLAMAVAIFRRRPDDWEYERADEPDMEVAPPEAAAAPRRGPAARIALAATFTTLFFAGASFTAGAGDQLVKLTEEDAAALEAATAGADAPAPDAMEAPAAEPAPAEPAPVPAEPAPAEPTPTQESPAESTPAAPEPPTDLAPAGDAVPSTAAAEAAEPAPAEAATVAPAPPNVAAPAPAARSVSAARPKASPTAARTPAPRAKGTRKWVVKRAAAPPARAPEVEEGQAGATVWLNRALPDPTPASARLSRRFAKQLVAASRRAGADWAAVLGVLRAQGERGSVPATARELETLANRMTGPDDWKAALALSGRTGFADRAAALADLYRFVGLESLVTGFAAAKERLAKKLLSREGVLIYDGGRSDIAVGRIDVRVIVLLGYLAERHGSLTVSSLFSGHRMFARPGVVSAHMYGLAVDIAAVGGTAIVGNQQPGGVTEAAIRSTLLLPAELQPQQVISLLGLGGPSFPLRDHGDHIHVGY